MILFYRTKRETESNSLFFCSSVKSCPESYRITRLNLLWTWVISSSNPLMKRILVTVPMTCVLESIIIKPNLSYLKTSSILSLPQMFPLSGEMFLTPLFEGGFISLPASSIILVSTEEFIGARRDITTMMKPRSSLGRVGISMVTGGWGDIGYINRWTVCLSNNTNCNMKLPVGERFAQIIFLRSHYPNKLYSGQYQNSDDLFTLMKEWTPMSMLPKELK